MKCNKRLPQQIQTKEWHTLKENHIFAQGYTKFQHYRISELEHYGKSLILNDCIQSTQYDEGFYHEALLFPALVLHGNVKNIICFGGANGGVVKRLALIPSIENVIQIDIDEILYHISQYYLSHLHPSIHPEFKLELYFSDPLTWIKKNLKRYQSWADLIIADLPDATEDCYATKLFTNNFYHNIKLMLKKEGIFVTQAGQAHPFNMDFSQRVYVTLSNQFRYVHSYNLFIPSYGVPWAFMLASKQINSVDINRHELTKRINKLPAEVKNYNFHTHLHMFNLLKPIRENYNKNHTVIESENLAYVKISPNKKRRM